MRWTVCAESMKKVIDNHESLLQLWEECLEKKHGPKSKGIKVNLFFFFGINLSYNLYAMPNNLSKQFASIDEDANHQGKEMC